MALIILVFSVFSAVCSGALPPDFDVDYEYVHEPPAGLSAGWAGDDVYLSWNRMKDRHGHYVTGYRLYRAANADSAFVQVSTGEEHNLILSAGYLDYAESLKEAGVVQTVRFFYKVTAVVVKNGTLYETYFSGQIDMKRKLSPDCFISTAAYGTPAACEVAVLSNFRDSVLLRCAAGKRLAGIYAKISPPIAVIIKDSPLLRSWVRMHLTPAAAALKLAGF